MAHNLARAIAIIDLIACEREAAFKTTCIDAAVLALPRAYAPNASAELVITDALGIDRAKCADVLRACRDVFIHASARGLDGASLARAMLEEGSSATAASAFGASWTANETTAMKAIRAEPFGVGGQVLTDVQWELKVPIAGAMEGREMLASIDLELSAPTPSGEPERKYIQLEFNKEEMLDFFGKIEKIQSQLDALM